MERNVNIAPEEGILFKYWLADGIELTADSKINPNLSFVMPENDVTIRAVFVPKVSEFVVEIPETQEGIVIRFTGNANTHYILLRSETEDFANAVEIDIGQVESYTDSQGVVPGKTYYYKLRGYYQLDPNYTPVGSY